MSETRRLPARDLALIALFAGLIAALGLPGTLNLFGNAVPVTAQTLGVMLAGSILGAKRGFLAVLVFAALVAAGLPLLAGGRGGLGVFAGPSVGYFLGWLPGVWVVGWLTEQVLARGGKYSLPIGLVANIAGGILVVYALGIPLQAWRIDASGVVATAVAALIYLPGDLIKAVVATLVAKGVHTGYPTLGREIADRRSGTPQ
jgi:biotin transport system substrate-specific component